MRKRERKEKDRKQKRKRKLEDIKKNKKRKREGKSEKEKVEEKEREKDNETNRGTRQIDRQREDRFMNIQIVRQTDRQKNRLADRQTDRHIDIERHKRERERVKFLRICWMIKKFPVDRVDPSFFIVHSRSQFWEPTMLNFLLFVTDAVAK